MQNRGFQKGELVGIVAQNSPFFVVAYLAVIMAGLVAVPVPPDRNETCTEIVETLALNHLFIAKRYVRLLDVLGSKPGRTCWTEEVASHPLVTGTIADLQSSSTGCIRPAIDPGTDLAALMLTSGSSGHPKAVMVTHGNIGANTRDIASYLGLTPADRVMAILPFHYCFGLSLLHSHLLTGGSVILNNGFAFPETVLDDMEAKAATNLAGVPSTYQILLRRSTFLQRELPSLRFLQQAGGKLPDALIEEIHRTFPNIDFYTMYGQTEATARLSYLSPELLDTKLGSVGRGLPSTTLEVLDEDGNPISPGGDDIGEVVASGPNITLGYFRDPEETDRFFRNGRLWTGDLARVDEDGFIYIVGRRREFIKPMGYRVSPLEIESVIAELPQVVEAGVFGVPDVLVGEKIRALIVPIPDCAVSEDTVIRHCRRRLPEYKVPHDVRSVGALPKNSQGKLARTALADIFDSVVD